MKLIALCILTLAASAASTDPWNEKELTQPQTLASMLESKAQAKPAVFYVGFPALYKGGRHIAGAVLAGPCSKAEGLEALKKAAADVPREREVYLYCGCCPFVKCPNIRPGYDALRAMGFTRTRVVYIETNLHTDWISKGYPSESGGQ